jgi:hypothetical protein
MTDDDICGVECVDGSDCQRPSGWGTDSDIGPCRTHDTSVRSDDPAHRPSKFDDVRDDLLKAANSFKNIKQVANAGGLKSKKTLYTYLDEHPDFLHAFKRARADAADRLIRRGLDENDDIDMGFVRFLLERSFKFVKTERKEVSGPDGGPVPIAAVPTDEQIEAALAKA